MRGLARAGSGAQRNQIRPRGVRRECVMWTRLCAALTISLFCLFPDSAQENTKNKIFETIVGRFHCDGEWRDFNLHLQPAAGPLGIADEDEPNLNGALSFYFHR